MMTTAMQKRCMGLFRPIILVAVSLALGTSVAYAGINEDFRSSLRSGDPNLAKTLIAQGADVNAADNTTWNPLMIAIQRRNLDLVRLLLDHGAKSQNRIR